MKNFISAMFFAITALLVFSDSSHAATQDFNFNNNNFVQMSNTGDSATYNKFQTVHEKIFYKIQKNLR